MSEDKKRREEDDGRTIADMSALSDSSLSWFGRMPEGSGREGGRRGAPHEAPQFSRRERFFAVLGALKASLLIGLAFIGGLGILILLLQLIWNIF